MDSFPSSSAGTSSSLDNSQRSSASSVLWAHLLRKDVLTSPTKADLPLPPLAPVDKSATSTRILLLDTQAHLQKFAQVVDDLTSKVDNAKHEIVTVKTLFQQDREVFMNDVVDRLNRNQSEIQKSMGKPAQTSGLEDVQKILELRLQNMDQRLDSLQMLHQTYSQTLQIQTQALQSLQDQQSTIIGALVPLLPLLQTIPPQIESARANLSESLLKLSSVQLAALTCHKNLLSPASEISSRKRSNSSSFVKRKRLRVDKNLVEHPHPTVGRMVAVTSSPIQSRNLLTPSTRPHHIITTIGRKQSQKTQIAYRPPLAELPLKNYRATPHPSANLPGQVDILEHVPRPETPVIIPQTPFIKSSDLISQFRQGYVQPPLKQATERSPTVSIADASSSHLPSSPYVSTTSVQIGPRVQARRTIDPKSKFKPAIHVLAHASHLQNAVTVHTPTRPTTFSKTNTALAAAPILFTPTPLIASTTDAEPMSTNTNLQLDIAPLAPPTLRQRRSPFREGRRFIPLDDSDTSDDEHRQT